MGSSGGGQWLLTLLKFRLIYKKNIGITKCDK